MKEDIRIEEQLSALVDGELESAPARFLLRRLGHDATLAGRWQRYHLAGACLRGSVAMPLDAGFAARVAAAVADEPVPRRSTPGLLRWTAGAAVAAAVAVVALVVVQPRDGVPGATLPGPGDVAVAPVSERDLRPDFGGLAAQTVAARQAQRLAPGTTPVLPVEPYLVRHNQALAATGRASFVPYVHLLTPAAGGRQPVRDEERR